MPTDTETGSFLPADDRRATRLESDPFRALNYHFGMLLGDEDFRTDQGYHRGKTWLHTAWLHREGVVWGFAVPPIDEEAAEVRVTAGLALDAAGRELHLDRDACLHLPSWFRDHRDDEGFEPEPVGEDGAVRFDARVVACFRACLASEVPALSEPCAGARGGGTAFSRVLETVHLRLEPVTDDGTVEDGAYRRVRILFGLVEADPEREDDAEALAARQAIEALDPAERPAAYAAELRRLALLDAADMEPAGVPEGEPLGRTPGGEEACLVLAHLRGIEIAPDGDGFELRAAPTVDRTACPVHVATRIIQELACGPGGAAVADAGGPRVMPASVERVDDRTLRLRTDRPLLAATAVPAAFAVTSLDDAGWTVHDVDATDVTASGDGSQVELSLGSDLAAGVTWRLIARGTGPTPILGEDGAPLAGAVGGPASGPDDGRDFVFVRRS